jgi:lysophospholipase L1-like esterase
VKESTKKILFISGIAIIVVATGLTFYFLNKKRNITTKKLKNPNPKKILFVGDSQTAIKSSSGGNITFTYPNILKKNFSDKQIDVLALVGKQTSWMLENLPAQLKNNKYDRIYIYGGGNDTSSGTKVDTTLSNIQKMVDISNENGADVFVNTGWIIEGESGRFGNPYILPITKYVTSAEQWKPLLSKRKELQERIPKEIKNASFIMPYDLKQKTSDGIHPTQEGHKLVAQYVSDTLV